MKFESIQKFNYARQEAQERLCLEDFRDVMLSPSNFVLQDLTASTKRKTKAAL